VGHSAHQLWTSAPRDLWSNWLILAALTLLSGSATVRLPSVPATISISETFVFTSVILFGPSAGALIVALDGLIISCWFVRQRREVHRVLFNVAAPALSIWVAAKLYVHLPGITALYLQPKKDPIELGGLIFPIALFALTHFVLNTWFIAGAVAFETRRSPLSIWKHDFLWLSLNYLGGASVAALLVVYTRDINLKYLGAIVPLLLIIYFTFKVPMARVEDANRHLSTLNRLYLSTIETLAMAIDAKDQVTHGHIRRVQTYAVGLAKELGVSDDGLLRAIEASALLHDMGKLAIPEHILNKPGKLTVAEFEKMKLHAAIGADLLSAIEFPYPVVPIVRHHHENWDGSGYPDGLKGTDIPIAARILAVVDCFDALTSDRPYRPALSDETAAAILRDRRGTMYDPLVVDTFLAVHHQMHPSEPQITSEQRQFIAHIAELNQPDAVPRSDGHQAKAASANLTVGFTEAAGALDAALSQSLGVGSAVMITAYNAAVDGLRVSYVSPDCEAGTGMSVGRRIGLGERLTGWVAATNRRIVNSDAALDTNVVGSAGRAVFNYCSALPLRRGDGNFLGVLTLYTQSQIQEAGLKYIELVLPRLQAELEQACAGGKTGWEFSGEMLRSLDEREEIVRTLSQAFGWSPITLRVRLKDRDPHIVAKELLNAVDTPVKLTDLVLAGAEGELLVISPRREELRGSLALWARARDSHRRLHAQITDLTTERLSA